MTFETLNNHPDYLILNEYPFTIKKRSNNYIINEWFDTKGYVTIKLNQRSYKKHRIIAEQFIPNDDPINKTQVDHINHDKSDYHLQNLRWISNQDNCKNKSKHRSIDYIFINELNEETSFEITSFKDREFHNYFYDFQENAFYFKTSENLYRQLHINNDRGSKFVIMNDINNKPKKIYINSYNTNPLRYSISKI